MTLEYKIINKNSIHIIFDKDGAKSFLAILSSLLSSLSTTILFDESQIYRGKRINGFIFFIVDEGEYVSFKEGLLQFEIEKEMTEEFILFIENAIKDDGFKTPEIISFSPKSKRDANVTIYGFLDV